MKKITLLLIMLFVSIFSANAQAVAYGFSQSSGTYTEITGGTVLGAEASDDQRFVDPAVPLGGTTTTGVGLPIGFNFVFNGDVYDRFAVNNNGWISLGKSSLGATAININSTNSYLPLSSVVAMSDDLVARIAGLGKDMQGQVGSTLRYELSGTAPNQVLTIQWKNYRKYNNTGDNFNFQIKLYETTNVVEVVYGAFTCNATTGTYHVGLRGATATAATNFASRTSTTSWATTASSIVATDAVTMLSANVPSSGLTFTWTPPACPGAVGLSTTALSNTTATVVWNQPTPVPANGYEYVVSTANVTPTAPGTASATNTASLLGLAPDTVHYVFVRTDCGASVYGNWVLMGTFRTQCDPITEFVETFDTYTTGPGVLPTCWRAAGTGSVYNITGSTAPMSPANRLYMTISATTTAFAVLPPVSNLQAETHKLKFKAHATTASKKLRVGYFTNPTDVSTYVFFQEIDMPSTTTASSLEFTVIPTAIPAGVTSLVFSIPSGTATTIYIDDVKWLVNSTCAEPTALTTASVTNNSAQLAWTSGGTETEWEVQYGLTGFAYGTGTMVTGITSNPYLLSGLNPDTSYQYYVRGVCTGPVNSSWSGPYTFRTLCNYVTDFVETFDTTPTGAGNMPACWSVLGTGVAYNTTGSTAPMSPANKLYMNIAAATTVFAKLPPVSNLQAETHRLKFKAYASTTLKKIRVGYFTNPADVSTYVFFEEIDLPSTAATATEFTVVPYTIPVGVTSLVFSIPPGVATTIYVDDVKWEENSSCVEPTALNANQITNTSAQLSWVNGGAEPEWQIQYGITGFTLGTGTIVTGVMTNPYVLSPLTSSTTYQYYVRGVCSGPTYSSWSGPFTFKTLCDAVTEYSENFDSYTTGANSLPNCWSRGGSSTATYITSGSVAPMSPANKLYMYASSFTTPQEAFAILPPVSNLQANTHRLRFKTYATTNPRDLVVGYLTDASDVSTFVALQTFSVPGTVVANTQEYVVLPGALPVGVKCLAIKNPSFTANSATFYIDDVAWEAIPACSNPTSTLASGVTNNSAQISWVGNTTDVSWEIEYGPTGFTLGSGTIVAAPTNPFTLTSLTSQTTYQFYVRAICAGPLTSVSSLVNSFTTLCDSFTPDYTQNFATFPASCWRSADAGTIATGPTGTGTGFWVADGFLNNTTTGALRANLFTPNRIGWMISPLFNLSAGGYQVKYDVGATNYSVTTPATIGSDDKVDFAMSTDGGLTWTSLELFNTTNAPTNVSTTKVYNISTVTSSSVLFAFRADEGPVDDAADWEFFVDNFKIDTPATVVPACATNVVATQAAGCGNFPITLTWDATPTANGYRLSVGTTAGGTDIVNNVDLGSVLTYAIITPTPSTTYYYTVTPYNGIGNATGCTELNFVTPSTICACTPIYVTGVSSSDFISNLVLQGTTLSNNSGTSTTAPAYNYYTGQPNYTATLTEGTAYTFAATIGYTGQSFSVWIDFNDDLVFTETERVGFTTANLTGTGGTFPMTVPCGANPGLHRMRVRMIYSTVGSTMDPCTSASYGETEDYDVTIVTLPAPTGDAAQTVCGSGTIANLVAVGSTGATIKWYDAATLGTELPSTTALVSGTTYYASQIVGTCESTTRLAVTATVTSQVTPSFDPVAAICSGSTAPTLPLTSTNGITGTWSPLTVDNMATATYTFTADSGQCVTTTPVTLDVTVNALPATPTGDAAQTFCPADSGVLADLAVTGTNLVWYDAATGGTVLPNTTTITATTYYVASNNGTCDSQRLAITTTEDCPVAPCLTSVNGQWPGATFVPNSANCDGYTLQNITTCGYASEYSVVTVVSGQTYTFASYTAGVVNSDVITISTDGGLTAVATGIGSVTWVATVSGDIRFYTHLDGCAAESVCRTRTLTCGVITTDSPDYVSLQWPPTITIPQGGNGTVYGQIYEGTLTDVVPNIDGQAPGITAWVGVSPIASNTNPNTWTNWVPATWNSGHISNNDEYQATIGATLLPGTYYYATRFRLNSGAYVYGGMDSSNNGNFWNGTTYNSGILTVTPPPAPANDDCAGAYSVTVNSDLACTSVTAGTLVGATASTTDATACGGTEDDDVWFSFVATATTHQVSLNDVTGSTTDLYHSLWTGADCASLALVPGTCSDPNTSTPTGLTIGATYYVRVYSWTATAGQTSVFNVCVGSFPPAPSNDVCSSPVALTVGGVFADNDIDTSNAGATLSSETPIPTCGAFNFATNGKDVWYSLVVPASGTVTIETGVTSSGATGIDTVIAAYTGSCGALTQVGCDDDTSLEFTYGLSLLSLTGQTPGATILVRAFGYNGSFGNYSISAYDASLGNGSFDSSNFTFYPNPVKDVLNLSYSQNINKVQVINILGQEVKTVSMDATQAQVDMSNLPTGTYLVKVTSDNQVKTIKVIKQ